VELFDKIIILFNLKLKFGLILFTLCNKLYTVFCINSYFFHLLIHYGKANYIGKCSPAIYNRYNLIIFVCLSQATQDLEFVVFSCSMI